MINIIEMSDAIRRRRTLLNFTQADIAELSGVSLRTIRDMEKGSGQSSLANWKKVLDVLGLTFQIRVKDTIDA
jgi:transcriptional regulator with XRE-family HTH domain